MKQKIFFPLTLIIILTFLLSGCSSGVMNADGWPGLTVADDTIYIAYANNIRAADLKNGSEIWHFPDEGRATFFAKPTVTDDLVIVGDYNNALHAIDKTSGVEQWSFTGAKGRWISGVLIVDDTIFAPCADHQLYILDINGKKITSIKMDEALWAAPISDGKMIYLSSMDHHLYAISTQSHEIEWSVDLGGAIVSSPAIDESGTLYIGTLAKEVYAIDSSNGALIWSAPFNTQGNVWASILIDNNTLYFGDATGNFYALDAQTGKQIWSDNSEIPIVASASKINENILVPTQTGEIYQYNIDGKKKNWGNIENGTLFSSPEITQDMVIFAVNKSEDELLIAYDLDGMKLWSSSYQESK